EFDRYARFHSWGSARETFSWNDMCKVRIGLPPIDVQRKYVAVFKALLANNNGSEDIKNICPVLIKGAIEEGGR
ncbi:MAG: restriction endonuclease subunit S, partial [Ruminococcus sp.]|nr:restriction endonuclease subunit S [Ruminococcus sp.]